MGCYALWPRVDLHWHEFLFTDLRRPSVAHKCRYADVLAEYHDDDHLVKFEELLEAAVDLDKIPDEYLICASYDAGLQVYTAIQSHTASSLMPALTHSLMHALQLHHVGASHT